MKKYSPHLSLAAGTVAGIAMWISRASFDVAGTTANPERVAMLPSLAELLGFVVMALLICAGIALLARAGMQSTTERPGFWEPVSDAFLPLFGLALLLLPYLPWLPDRVPALRLLAGPARYVLWIVVLGHLLAIVVPLISRRFHAPTVESSATSGAIFAVVAVFLCAPFLLNARSLPAAFVDLWNTIRALPDAAIGNIGPSSLGLLFDQEYGLIVYAPVLLLGFAGLAGMIRSREYHFHGVALTVAALVLVLLPATVDPWWSRNMMPGRPVLLLIPLLAFPIAWMYARISTESRRAAAWMLLLVSVAISVFVVVFDDQVPARQEADGVSSLLQWVSPAWHLWAAAPSYVIGSAAQASLRLLLWAGAFAIIIALLGRARIATAGRAALAVTTLSLLTVITLASTTDALLSQDGKRFDVEGRVLFPLLESYDSVARPIAVRYDAFSVVTPGELPPLFALSAVPGQRTDPQPIRVLLNARFRLPPGEYEIDLTPSTSVEGAPRGTMALQIGREGRPLRSWPLTIAPGSHVRHRFRIPLEAEFVGFRVPRRLEQSIAELRLIPVSVIERRRRFPAPTVLSAAPFGPATLFFHDSYVYAEREGFWVGGRRTTRATIVKSDIATESLELAIHSGAKPNSVTVSTPRWSQQLELVPGTTQRVTVPLSAGEPFIPLSIIAADGFVPAQIEPSRDRRLLGAWIAFIPDDISRTSSTP